MIKNLLSSLPTQRLLFYVLLLTFLPAGILTCSLFSKNNYYSDLNLQLENVTQLLREKERREAGNKIVKRLYKERSAPAMEKSLEKLTLLKSERERLEKAMKKPSFVGNPVLEARLAFLKEGGNRLHFTSTQAPSKNGLQETLLALREPAEIDGHDLKEILSLVEQSAAPGSLFTDFHLTRKRDSYVLQCKYLKRDFL